MSFDDSDFISFSDILGDEVAEPSAGPASKSERRTSQKRTFDQAQLDKDEEDVLRNVDRSTPWTNHVSWDQVDSAEKQLHAEILAFVDYITPTQSEHALRLAVVDSISKAICDRWEDAVVEPFGSFQTELYLPSGDIDLVVLCDSMGPMPGKIKSSLFAIAALLRARGLASDIVVIHKARVPIIKFKSCYGKFAVDISINRPGGPSAGLVVKRLLSEVGEVAAKSLIMVVKAFLLQRGLNEVFSGGLGSYSIICMVVSFLQLHPKVQTQMINPSKNLGVLLVEFFELYGKNFNFDEVGVSVKSPGGYFSKVAKGWQRQNQPYLLSIEDPQDPTNDISGSSHNILSVRQSIAGAFDLLAAALCQRKALLDASSASRTKQASTKAHLDPCKQSILGSIIGMHPEVTAARNKNAELALSGLVQQQLGLKMPVLKERRSFSQRAASPTGSAEMEISESEAGPSVAPTPIASTSTSTGTSVSFEENASQTESEVRKGKRKAKEQSVLNPEDVQVEPKKKKKKKDKKAEASAVVDMDVAAAPLTSATKAQLKAEKLAERLDQQVAGGADADAVWKEAEDNAENTRKGIRIFGMAKRLAQSSPAPKSKGGKRQEAKATKDVPKKTESTAKAKATPQPKISKASAKKFESTAQFLPLSENEDDGDVQNDSAGDEDDSRYSLRRNKASKAAPPTPKSSKASKKLSKPKNRAEASTETPVPLITDAKTGEPAGFKIKGRAALDTDADFIFVGDSDMDVSTDQDDDLQINTGPSKPLTRKQKYWAAKKGDASTPGIASIDYEESPPVREPGSD